MSPPAEPLVSVLVPSFNYARYLPEAIDSILAQTLTDFELIIIDNGSSDGSAEIIRQYAGWDDRVRHQLRTTNVGMVENCNGCLAQARGKYVKFLLADDRLGSTAIEELVSLLESEPGVTLAASSREIINERSKTLRIKSFAASATIEAGPRVIARCVGTGTNLIGEPSAVLFRRADAARGFNRNYTQLVDLEMWFHLLRRGDLAFTSKPLCAVRRHEQQQSCLNRGTGIHENELGRLLASSDDIPAVLDERELLTAWLYRLGKIKRTHQTGEAMGRLERRLGPRRYFDLLAYGLSRPWANLNRRLQTSR